MSQMRFIEIQPNADVAGVDFGNGPEVWTHPKGIMWVTRRSPQFTANADGILALVELREKFEDSPPTPGTVVPITQKTWQVLEAAFKNPGQGYYPLPEAVRIELLLPYINAVIDAPTKDPRPAPPPDAQEKS